MNQGQFRVYSPDLSIHGVDTINVMGGRFEYETECYGEGIIVIVLPNHYELPVFVKPGKSIDMKADATNIKDIDITGTDANEMMTAWRKANASLPLPQQTASAEKFIRENPASIVSVWLLYKFFVKTLAPDMKKIKALADLMQKAVEHDNDVSVTHKAWISNLSAGIATFGGGQVGDRMPSFLVKDIYGKEVSSADYVNGNVVVTFWANYNYDSQNINHQLRTLKNRISSGDQNVKAKPFKVISISLDAAVADVKASMHRDSLPWPVICDQKMWQSPMVSKFGFSHLPDNMLIKDGRIVGRCLSYQEIEEKLK